MSIPTSLYVLRMSVTVLKTYLLLPLMVDLHSLRNQSNIGGTPRNTVPTGHLKILHYKVPFDHPFERKHTAA